MGFKNRITLAEIMLALIILAVAFIPLVGLIGTGATDTDITNSYIFAQTAARSILENLLDSVPFECIHLESNNVSDLDGSNPECNVARFENTPNYNVASFLALIGNTIDNFGRGTLIDSRGTSYFVKIFVFPLQGLNSDNPDSSQELVFNYLARPLFENAVNSEGKPTWYTSADFVQPGVKRPYDYGPDDGIKVQKVNAYKLGVPAGTISTEQYCMIKKILLRIRWNMPKNKERFLEIYTVKANLSKTD